MEAQTLTKGEQSRNQILIAAKTLIAQRGFNAITVQDILEAAGVTKGKFFYYFSSKEDLYGQLLRFTLSERSALRFEILLKDCSSARPSDKLVFLLDRMIEWHTKGLPDVMRLCILATFFFEPDSPEMLRIHESLAANSLVLEKLIREAQSAGELPKDLNASVWSLLFASSAVGGNLVGFLSGKRDLTSKALIELRKSILIFQKSCRSSSIAKGPS
ncbi:MAG: TetR/AcrR family transcriptional regulator [Deltaproteobacteria bacterium]|nr:TetR/AcrR family transcriptional regulator [Deltaproteobacteria bacterium]